MAFPDPNKLYTPAEYLAMEAVAEEKSNYCDGHIFQTMTAVGNEERHDHIRLNIRDALQTRLVGTLYKVSDPPSSGTTAAVKSHGSPDIAVFRARSRPLIVFEVISPRNEATDRGAKASQYRTVESVQIQVIVAQHLPEVEVFLRMPDECWSVRFLSGLDETIELPLIDVKLPLAEIYRRVRFPVEPYLYT